VKKALLALCWSALVLCARAQEVKIGVLGLFHPRQIIVTPLNDKTLQCESEGLRWDVTTPLSITLAPHEALSIPRLTRQFRKQIVCKSAGSYAAIRISIPGKITRRYVGNLQIGALSKELQVVISMPLETAVASVVAAESVPHAPIEALKAQAIASRSYLVAGKGSHRNFDFCDNTHCQFLREPPPLESPAYKAAKETRGVVLGYQGAPFAAMYSRSCGGKTHSLEDLGIPVRGYPYFSVECNYCLRHPERWTTHVKQSDASALNTTEASRLKLARRLGWKTLPSNSYIEHSDAGGVLLEGLGVGHGLGLCQRGGADMARHGATFEEILAHYYPNSTLQQIPEDN
jgi:stage II sporulation protein D